MVDQFGDIDRNDLLRSIVILAKPMIRSNDIDISSNFEWNHEVPQAPLVPCAPVFKFCNLLCGVVPEDNQAAWIKARAIRHQNLVYRNRRPQASIVAEWVPGHRDTRKREGGRRDKTSRERASKPDWGVPPLWVGKRTCKRRFREYTEAEAERRDDNEKRMTL